MGIIIVKKKISGLTRMLYCNNRVIGITEMINEEGYLI